MQFLALIRVILKTNGLTVAFCRIDQEATLHGIFKLITKKGVYYEARSCTPWLWRITGVGPP